LTCCLITGFPDLSVGSHVALANGGSVYVPEPGHVPGNGHPAHFDGRRSNRRDERLYFSRTGMPAYIVTLGMQNVLRGVAYVLTNGGAVIVSNERSI
jgi:predicted ABC-type sugar transport system permease subunit